MVTPTYSLSLPSVGHNNPDRHFPHSQRSLERKLEKHRHNLLSERYLNRVMSAVVQMKQLTSVLNV